MLTNEEYVKRLGQLYDHIMKFRKDEDYVVNQPQMDKLVDTINFFIDIARQYGGDVEPVQLTPKEEHGGVTANFIVFDIHGEEIKRFCSVVKEASALTIDATTDHQVCISLTIPNVFVPKE